MGSAEEHRNADSLWQLGGDGWYSLVKTDSSVGVTAFQHYTAGRSLSLGTVFLRLLVIHTCDSLTPKQGPQENPWVKHHGL